MITDKKHIKKLIRFLLEFRAPLRFLPWLISIVLAIVKQFSEDDVAQNAVISEQRVFLHSKEPYVCGCSACAVDGTGVAAAACAALEDGAVVNKLVIFRASSVAGLRSSRRAEIYSTPLQISSVKLGVVSGKVFVIWHEETGGEISLTPGLPDEYKQIVRAKTRSARCGKPGGTFCAVVDDENRLGEIFGYDALFTSAPVDIGGGEALVPGIAAGHAVIFKKRAVADSFELLSRLPSPKGSGYVGSVSICRQNDGRLLAALSCERSIYLSCSDDMGVTWSVPSFVCAGGDDPFISSDSTGNITLVYCCPEKAMPVRARVRLFDASEFSEEKTTVVNVGKVLDVSTAKTEDGFVTFSVAEQFHGENGCVMATIWKFYDI